MTHKEIIKILEDIKDDYTNGSQSSSPNIKEKLRILSLSINIWKKYDE